MSVVNVADTGRHVLIRSALDTPASVTSATDGLGTAVVGVLNGTAGAADFNAVGFNPANGGISFANFARQGTLAYEGQIAFDVEIARLADADISGQVSTSEGILTAATQYICSWENSGGTDQGYIRTSGVNTLQYYSRVGDTQKTLQLSTRGLGSKARFCFWWRGSKFGLKVDGMNVDTPGTRTGHTADFYKIILGASWNGTASPIDARFSNLAVSNRAPLSNYKQVSIGIFGNSYAVQQVAVATIPRYNAIVRTRIDRALADYGVEVTRWIDGGSSGYTCCDTGSADLSSTIAAFALREVEIAVLFLADNDSNSASDAQVAHATTGTLAKAKDFIERIAFRDAPTTKTKRSRNRKIIVLSARSYRQDTSLDTAANNARLLVVNAAMRSLPAWFDATYPAYAGLVKLEDMHTLLGGDVDSNTNYQGHWNTLGNATISGVANANDAHLSAVGCVVLGDAIAAVCVPVALGQ